jgi:hypothetical protein
MCWNGLPMTSLYSATRFALSPAKVTAMLPRVPRVGGSGSEGDRTTGISGQPWASIILVATLVQDSPRSLLEHIVVQQWPCITSMQQ